jgi:hypothetical protein
MGGEEFLCFSCQFLPRHLQKSFTAIAKLPENDVRSRSNPGRTLNPELATPNPEFEPQNLKSKTPFEGIWAHDDGSAARRRACARHGRLADE